MSNFILSLIFLFATYVFAYFVGHLIEAGNYSLATMNTVTVVTLFNLSTELQEG